MAVSGDELVTPLPADGSAVRDDLIYLAGLLGWVIPVAPSNGAYQLASWLGRWFSTTWNSYAVPALRGQWGDFAAGDWNKLLWRGKGVDWNGATFASAPVVFENRVALFQDLTALGAVQVSFNGTTYVSQGPPPGSTGTIAIWTGSGPFPTTTLIMQATVVGTGSNALANVFPVYPLPLASGPAGVYVVSNAPLLGSNGESDAALTARGRSAVALSAPVPFIDKVRALVLGTKVPATPPVPVATNRIRIVGSNATMTVYGATPSGPTPGSVGDPTTELGAINARVQLLCGVPGLTVTMAAASPLSMSFTITLYVTAKSNVSEPQALATATAALLLWGGYVVPVGGFRKVVGGQGYVFADEVLAIAKSRVNPSYPDPWVAGTYYSAGADVSNLGQTFTALSPGTSGSSGPSGAGGVDGGAGLVWSPTTATGSGSQFDNAPGVFAGTISGFTDTAVAPNQVPVFLWTVSVVIVDQGS